LRLSAYKWFKGDDVIGEKRNGNVLLWTDPVAVPMDVDVGKSVLVWRKVAEVNAEPLVFVVWNDSRVEHLFGHSDGVAKCRGRKRISLAIGFETEAPGKMWMSDAEPWHGFRIVLLSFTGRV
jgi:hypothetical protein